MSRKPVLSSREGKLSLLFLASAAAVWIWELTRTWPTWREGGAGGAGLIDAGWILLIASGAFAHKHHWTCIRNEHVPSEGN